jgi:hypothetical protein
MSSATSRTVTSVLTGRFCIGAAAAAAPFHSVPDLTAAIDDYLQAHNTDPKPFIWTASIDSILEKVGRCKAVLETVH